jgi:transposase
VPVGERSAIFEIEEGGLRVRQRPEAVVVGRKNHCGSKPKRGAEVAAFFDTLVETAKLSGVDPRACTTLVARRATTNHGAVTLPSDLT